MQYAGLNDPAVYTLGAAVAYPRRNVPQGPPVVKLLRVDNGQGGWLDTAYRYGGLRLDANGRQLGFETLTRVDLVNGTTTATTFSQDWPTLGMATGETVTQANGTVLSSATHLLASLQTLPGTATWCPYVSRSVATTRDLNNALMATTTTAVDSGGIDAYCNITATTRTVADANGETFTTQTLTSYQNDEAAGLLGLPTRVAITKSAPGVASVTRTVATAYFAGTAEVQSVTTEPDEPAASSLRLTTTFTRDAVYGVLQKKTLAWYDPVSASAQSRDVELLSGYDARMRWAQQLRNARGHLETRSFDEASGNPLSLTGPNQLSTTWQYDGWGRKTREDRADGSATTWAYRRCSDTCLTQAATVAVTQSWAGAAQTGVPAESFADRLGRTVLTRSWAFDGSPVLTEQVYSAAGRLVQVSRPRFASAAPVWTFYTHDALGRVLQM